MASHLPEAAQEDFTSSIIIGGVMILVIVLSIMGKLKHPSETEGSDENGDLTIHDFPPTNRHNGIE